MLAFLLLVQAGDPTLTIKRVVCEGQSGLFVPTACWPVWIGSPPNLTNVSENKGSYEPWREHQGASPKREGLYTAPGMKPPPLAVFREQVEQRTQIDMTTPTQEPDDASWGNARSQTPTKNEGASPVFAASTTPGNSPSPKSKQKTPTKTYNIPSSPTSPSRRTYSRDEVLECQKKLAEQELLKIEREKIYAEELAKQEAASPTKNKKDKTDKGGKKKRRK